MSHRSSVVLALLGSPIGDYIYNQVGVVRVIRDQMHSEIVRPIHAFMHHEHSRLYYCAFTGLQYHRTDGQFGRSAPLQDFDVGLLFEAQRTVTGICDLDGELPGLTELHVSIVNPFLIHGK